MKIRASTIYGERKRQLLLSSLLSLNVFLCFIFFFPLAPSSVDQGEEVNGMFFLRPIGKLLQESAGFEPDLSFLVNLKLMFQFLL